MYSKALIIFTAATSVAAWVQPEERAAINIGTIVDLSKVPATCTQPIQAVFSSLPTQPADFDLEAVNNILKVKSCSVTVAPTMTAPAVSYASDLLKWYSTNHGLIISVYDKCSALSAYSDFPNCVSNFIAVNKGSGTTATTTRSGSKTTQTSATATETGESSSTAAESGESASNSQSTASSTNSASSTGSAAATSASAGAAVKNTGMQLAAVAAAGLAVAAAL